MADQKLAPWVKPVLEFGPILAFFIVYMLYRDETIQIGAEAYSGVIVATVAFIPLLLMGTGLLWYLTGELSRSQIITAVLVLFFGGLTIWLNDERFIKMKPTAIYLLFAGTLGFGLLRGQSYLRYVMENMVPLKDEGWMILTRRFAAFFFALAIANEVVWRFLSTDIWVNFKTFGLPILLFAFVFSQAKIFERYSDE